MLRLVLLFLPLFLLPLGLSAQEDGDSAIPAIEELLNPPQSAPGASDDPFGMVLPTGFEPDDATRQSIQTAVRGFYDYRTEAFDHRMAVFRWQQVSTRIIFFVVIAVVAVGLYFSWLQFHATQDKSSMGTTSIEAGKSGFKISSPVLGVIILTLSLAFFYLYLVHVYPVTDTF